MDGVKMTGESECSSPSYASGSFPIIETYQCTGAFQVFDYLNNTTAIQYF